MSIISEKINKKLNRVNEHLRVEINRLIKKASLTLNNLS